MAELPNQIQLFKEGYNGTENGIWVLIDEETKKLFNEYKAKNNKPRVPVMLNHGCDSRESYGHGVITFNEGVSFNDIKFNNMGRHYVEDEVYLYTSPSMKVSLVYEDTDDEENGRRLALKDNMPIIRPYAFNEVSLTNDPATHNPQSLINLTNNENNLTLELSIKNKQIIIGDKNLENELKLELANIKSELNEVKQEREKAINEKQAAENALDKLRLSIESEKKDVLIKELENESLIGASEKLLLSEQTLDVVSMIAKAKRADAGELSLTKSTQVKESPSGQLHDTFKIVSIENHPLMKNYGSK